MLHLAGAPEGARGLWQHRGLRQGCPRVQQLQAAVQGRRRWVESQGRVESSWEAGARLRVLQLAFVLHPAILKPCFYLRGKQDKSEGDSRPSSRPARPAQPGPHLQLGQPRLLRQLPALLGAQVAAAAEGALQGADLLRREGRADAWRPRVVRLLAQPWRTEGAESIRLREQPTCDPLPSPGRRQAL